MATQKLTTLFEEVRTGVKGITAKDKKQADKDAVWFYEKYKTNFPKKTDTEIEKEAKILIDRFLYIDPLVIKELKSKHLKDISNPKFDKNGKKISIPPLEALIGKNLKSKLEKHFNQIEKPLEIEENASKKISRDLLEGLIELKLLPTWSVKKNLSTWSKNDISAVINLYHKKYHDLSIEKDDDFAAYKRLEAAYQRIAKYPVADREPEFFKSIVGQFVHWEEEPDKFFSDLNKDLKRKLKEYKSMDDQIWEEEKELNSKLTGKKPKKSKGIPKIGKVSIDDDSVKNDLKYKLSLAMPDSENENLSKIEKFEREILRTERIPSQPNRLLSILKEIVQDPNINVTSKDEIWNLCRERLIAEGIAIRNYDQIKSRLLKILKGNRGATGMLHLMSPVNVNLNLQAYRFSEEEIKKMIELKRLFENTSLGDYKFTFERFPEVYYDTYDNYVEIYGEIGDEDEEDNPNNYENKITPDYLGVYCDFSLPGNDYETKEGVIVLFKDRIEKYSKVIEKKLIISLKNAEDAIRMVILMHELGHWICHWPLALNDNWNLSYYNKAAQYKRTHEALANIITYWAVNTDKILSDVLENLTPKIKTNPYYLYKNLIPQAQEEIIKKIVDLRKHFYLTDDLSYLYLEDKMTRFANHLQVFLMPRASVNSEKISDYFFDSKKNKKIIELLDNKYEMDYRLFYENLILNTAKIKLDLPTKLYCLFQNEELNRKLHEINPKYNEDWAHAQAIICRYDIK